jgi:AP endonuclease-2
MYTCWETRKNARPGNYGSRIDYVLCSSGIKDWFEDSNIQEGLLGSDHCPVYATLKDTLQIQGEEIHVIDRMNPEGMFRNGKRLQEWCNKNLLPTSAKLIPEFDRRRSIRDMFFKPPFPSKNKEASPAAVAKTPETAETVSTAAFLAETSANKEAYEGGVSLEAEIPTPPAPPSQSSQSNVTNTLPAKRQAPSPASKRPQKKNKPPLTKESSKSGPGKSQSSLTGFFKPKTPTPTSPPDLRAQTDGASDQPPPPTEEARPSPSKQTGQISPHVAKKPPCDDIAEWEAEPPSSKDKVHDPVQARESWSKLLGKRVPPMCEHDEPCISLLTKKAGVNCGEWCLPSCNAVPPLPPHYLRFCCLDYERVVSPGHHTSHLLRLHLCIHALTALNIRSLILHLRPTPRADRRKGDGNALPMQDFHLEQ